ncbi:MAG: hypothetical protein WDM86_13880 [Rhizomicrobium sp.]
MSIVPRHASFNRDGGADNTQNYIDDCIWAQTERIQLTAQAMFSYIASNRRARRSSPMSRGSSSHHPVSSAANAADPGEIRTVGGDVNWVARIRGP